MGTRILLWSLLLGWAVSALAAEDYCALTVKPVDTHGWGAEAEVSLQELGGQKLQKKTAYGPSSDGARFCNLLSSPVTVTVQTHCGPLIVLRSIWLKWGLPRTLSVLTYDECPPFMVVVGCRVLIQFVDPQGNPLKGASFRMRTPNEEDYLADEFGRLLVGSGLKSEISGIATAEGYEPAEMKLTCTESKEILQTVTLTKPQ